MNFNISFFGCKLCNENFSRRDSLRRHLKSCIHRINSSSITKRVKKQKKTNIFCDLCQRLIPNRQFVGHLRSLEHKSKCFNSLNDNDVIKMKSAFKNRMGSYRIMNRKKNDIRQFLVESGSKVFNLFSIHQLPLKFNIELFCKYFKISASDEIEDIKSFNTKFLTFLEGDEFYNKYNHLCDAITSRSEEFQVYIFLFYRLT